MSRRRRRARGTAGAQASAHRALGVSPRRGGGPSYRVVWVVVAVTVACAGLWLLARHYASGGAGRAPGASTGDAIATMDPEAALRTARALGQAGLHLESLPYLRRALTDQRQDTWQSHFNYGTALYNATLLIEARNGQPVYAVRSSWERVGFMRDAVQEMLAAERLARTPHDLALVRSARARMLWVWGLPWETFAAYREAQFADPGDHALAAQADRYMDLMRSPATSAVAEPPIEVPNPR